MKTRFREARLKMQLTQSEVAEMLGVSQTTYNRYESGLIEPDMERLCKIADLFKVSIDYLLIHDLRGATEQIPIEGIMEIVSMYQLLDQRGKMAVCATLTREYEFSRQDYHKKPPLR